MQINGLLVTLSPESVREREAIARRLGERRELTVGGLTGRWLPVAMEAADDAQAREIHDWIGAQPGVDYVDVTSVSFEESGLICANAVEPPPESVIGGLPESAENPPLFSAQPSTIDAYATTRIP